MKLFLKVIGIYFFPIFSCEKGILTFAGVLGRLYLSKSKRTKIHVRLDVYIKKITISASVI